MRLASEALLANAKSPPKAPVRRPKDSLYGASPPSNGTIRVPKAAELVSNALRREIVRGIVQPGAALPQEKILMERFAVSRPTLREAIRILESEGLVRMTKGALGGALVQRPSVDVATRYLGLILQVNRTSLTEIYRVHALIEPAAARLVAESGNREAARELRECYNAGLSHLDNDFQFGTDTARFRIKLIELAGIPTLTLLIGVLDDILERCWAAVSAKAGLEIDTGRAKQRGTRSIEKLINLIEQGDGAGAEEHWRKHTAMVEKMMASQLDSTTIIDILDA